MKQIYLKTKSINNNNNDGISIKKKNLLRTRVQKMLRF